MPTRAKRSSRPPTAAMTAASTSGGRARGNDSGWRGMSVSNSSRRRGASAQPQAVMSSRKPRTVDGGVGVDVGPDGPGPVLAAPAGTGRGPDQEGLDVASFQPGHRRQRRVVVADELAEDGEG